MKWSLFSLIPLFATLSTAAPSAPGWSFNLKQTRSGIVALESIVVSPTLVVWFDRASNDPLQINNHSAWGALWNLETETVTPLDLITNSFCASGALLSNGTMVANYRSSAKYATSCQSFSYRSALVGIPMDLWGILASNLDSRPFVSSNPVPPRQERAVPSLKIRLLSTCSKSVGTRPPLAFLTAVS